MGFLNSPLRFVGNNSNAGLLIAANEGLSLSGTTVQLGQPIDATDYPALIADQRDIPMTSINTGAGINLFDPDYANNSLYLTPYVVQIITDGSVFEGTALFSITDANTFSSFEVLFFNNMTVPTYVIGGCEALILNPKIGIGAINNSPTAYLHIGEGGDNPGYGQLKFNKTTYLLAIPEKGTMEYDGVNLFFTRTGTTRENVLIGNSGAAAPPLHAAIVITNYFGQNGSKILAQPDNWAVINISGTSWLSPLYAPN